MSIKVPDKLPALFLARFLWLAVVVIIVCSLIAAQHTGDGHWVNRGGAGIAALGAASILPQIMEEMRLEDEARELEEKHGQRNWNPVPRTRIEELESELAAKALKEKMSRVRGERLYIASRVVVTAMIGELLHGGGDLAACSLLIACAAH
ncbi:hypothetical protein [Massilia sp. Root335]|uniref:hypothetical protein n=1 Tax=Massilia sp. Root335 TaxID=1736517 RepID=UPI0012F6BFE6|nr:hypothetical protein [Massilia sp. Root335]